MNNNKIDQQRLERIRATLQHNRCIPFADQKYLLAIIDIIQGEDAWRKVSAAMDWFS